MFNLISNAIKFSPEHKAINVTVETTDDLVKIAEDKIANIHVLFEKSDLPDVPDRIKVEKLMISIREEFYNGRFEFSTQNPKPTSTT